MCLQKNAYCKSSHGLDSDIIHNCSDVEKLYKLAVIKFQQIGKHRRKGRKTTKGRWKAPKEKQTNKKTQYRSAYLAEISTHPQKLSTGVMQERWKGLAWIQQPQDVTKLIAPLLQDSMDVISLY